MRNFFNPSTILTYIWGYGDYPSNPEVQSFIGVIIAVAGNVLISLALNIQKYAHNRIAYNSSNDLSTPSSPNHSLLSSSSSTEVSNDTESTKSQDSQRSTYLRSPWWWLGLILMTIGEIGNFIAYGFAPASTVAPLGTVALISNSIIAPLLLKERFRFRDFFGILLSISGAVTVVASSKSEEIKLSPELIFHYINQPRAHIYFLVTVILIGCLVFISENIQHHWVIFVDLTLVALFGAYTVLSTKAISSLLSLSFIHMFDYSITYLLIFIQISTAILQIKFVNKSLQQFDSTEVIPTQFVLFTISAITASAVVFGDFDDADFRKESSFIMGCLLTFVGVYFITSKRTESNLHHSNQPSHSETEPLLSPEPHDSPYGYSSST